MENKLCALLIVIGFSASPVLQQSMNMYYFVSELKTFTEAQLYCRATHTDLAVIENTDDLDTLGTDRVTYSGAWIGLTESGFLHWRWALADARLYKDGETKYRNWAPFEPDDGVNQNCVIMTYKGLFQNTNCLDPFNFICYDARGSEHRYVYISFLYIWREAQRYCRLYYTDLVSVRNPDENNQIMDLIPTLGFAYIGLFMDDFDWSDGSASSFRNWDLLQPDFLGECVAVMDNKFWKTELCGKLKPFFCYESAAGIKRQILRLEVKAALNVNDPGTQTSILAKIQQRLQKLGVTNITRLEWRTETNG
ncbi:secretory phospholipase A2 receptor-like [Puntigrus tetrazona]|uniref:secretory phospholipase A2 receptor-like n=1 Tax=Puntigrus tetrazona TaxID=1606681 RepID=UPI001C895F06|nr:secretory phospholipase A2 receptor-like [Puntigrus tetrazona]